ncbi:MAG: transporter [Gammaproteobacteria bacterium]|nr:transporter [Gammaproteobacteria bacterium]NNM11419.1 hypothetical protein [Pseudomonadales bacterium]
MRKPFTKAWIARLVSSLYLLAPFTVTAHSDNHYGHRSDGHAPIGVMADHFHNQGEWMLTLRTMNMSMKNEKTDFTVPVTASTPLEMETQMTMLGGMYGLSDSITLMMNLPYLDREMEMLMPGMMGGAASKVTTEASGFGDLKLGGAVRLRETETDRLHTTLMLSVPTGSIDETANMAMPGAMQNEMLLAPMMQLGSGTYDLISALTYVAFQLKTSVGAQWKNVVRLDENDRDYSLPNQNQATAWLAYNVDDSFSTSIRGQYFTRAGVDKRWDVGIGANYISDGGHRIAAEYLVPVDHDTDSVMEAQDYWAIGYQYSW